MTKLVCNYTTTQTKPSKKALTESRREQLELKVKARQALLAATAKTKLAAKTIKEAEMEKLIAHRTIDLQDFTTGGGNKWAAWVAEWFGSQQAGATREGKLLKSLFENKRNAGNLLKYVAHNNSFKTTEPMVKRFKQLAKTNNVDKKAYGKLMADLFEVGATKFDYNKAGGTQAVKELLQQRNLKFHADMIKAGFADNDIDELVMLSHNASKGFEDLRVFLNELGANIDKMDDIGYFPRIMTKDAEDYIKTKATFKRASGGAGVKADFAKARTSFWFTVEDRDGLAELLNISTDELDDAITDTAKLKSFIENSVSDEALELLIDSGMMSKVPMTSSELYEWMSTRYPLPFGNSFDDYFITDPRKVLEGYANEMESIAGSHGVAKALREQGQLKGVISEVQRDADDIEISALNSGDFLSQAGVSGYVNKNVARMLDVAIGIEKNPQKMSGLSQGWISFSSALKSQMLANPQYVARIFIGNAIQYASRGGDIPSLMSGISDVTKYLLKGIDSFDNTRPYRFIDGKNVTHKEFMQLFVSARGAGGAPAVDGLKRGAVNYDAINPLLFPKKVGIMAQMVKDMDVSDAFGYVFGESLRQYKTLSQTLLQSFATAAGYGDFVFKLALAKSVSATGNNSWDVVRQGLKLATVADNSMYSSFDEVLAHVDRAYLTFDDMGKAPKTLSHFIPFFSFTFNNMSGVVRDMLRNPVKYATVARVGSLIHQDIRETQETTEESELPFFMREDFPFKVWQDDNGNYGVLSITNITPLLSAAQDAQHYAKIFGIRNVVKQSAEDERKQAVDAAAGAERVSWQNSLEELFNKTQYGTFFSAVTGRGGRAVEASDNTFLGLPMNTATQGVIQHLVPSTTYLQSQNPFGVFGRREVLLGDELDTAAGAPKVQEQTKSVFGVDGTKFDNKAALWNRNPLLGAMARLGINVRYAEGKANTRNYYRSLDRDLKRLKSAYEELGTKKTSPDVVAKQQEIVQLYNKYEAQRLKLQEYMMQKGINDAQLEKELKTRRVKLEE